MPNIFTPLSPEYTILLPDDPYTWLAYAVWVGLVVLGMGAVWDRKPLLNRHSLAGLAILSALVLVLTPFFGVDLFEDAGARIEGLPVNHLMFFAAVPWMVGAGIVGLVPAVMIAGISGLLLAYLDTQTIATPLLFITTVLIYIWVFKQSRNTFLPKILSFPAAGALFSWLLASPLVFFSLILSSSGSFGIRFAQAFDAFPLVFLIFGGMVLIGGLTATIISIFIPHIWREGEKSAGGLISGTGNQAPVANVPPVRKLFLHLMLAFLLLLSILVFSVWGQSENAVRKILVAQLTQSARTAANGAALLIANGESQIQELADSRLLTAQAMDENSQNLDSVQESQTFFDMLVVLTGEGSPVASSLPFQIETLQITDREADAVGTVISENDPLFMIVPAPSGARAADLSFLARLPDGGIPDTRVLLGRVNLAESSRAGLFTQALEDLEADGGVVQIVDERGSALYHTSSDLNLADHLQSRFSTATFLESTPRDGQAMMMFYQPVEETGLIVITAFPVSVYQQATWEMASPLLLVGTTSLLVLCLAAYFLAAPLARELDAYQSRIRDVVEGHFLKKGVNERDRTNHDQEIFDQVLGGLTRRIQHQQDLLRVKGPLFPSPSLENDLMPIMKTALAQGVSSVRVVARPGKSSAVMGANQGSLGLGRDAHSLAVLDGRVAALVDDHRGPVTLQNDQIRSRLTLPEGMRYPAFLAAFPMVSENKKQGVFWISFSEKSNLDLEEVEFFKALSEKAADVLQANALLAELTHLQQNMAAALDQLPQAVLILNDQGKIVYHNHRIGEVFNLPAQAIAGKKISDFFEMQHLPFPTNLERKIETEAKIHLANGQAVHASKRPVDLEGGDAGSVLIFDALKAPSIEGDPSSEMVTFVSHALRSPLTLIHGYAKILRLTGNLNDHQDDYIVKIIRGMEEMRALVENLLDFSRLESQGMVTVSEFQAEQVLNQIQNSMAAQFRQKNIQLIVTAPEKPLMIKADLDLITLALKNLVENALKFTKMGGEVALKAEENKDWVTFAVRDTGSGISPLDQQRLFKTFRPGQTSTNGEIPGSGLGLAIVRSIVEHHGGKVWVESQLGKGSTFFFKIPKDPNDHG